MPLKKWTVLSSKYVLRRPPYIMVRYDYCRTTGRKKVTDYYVTERRDYCVVVAITPDGKVPVVRQYKHGAHEIIRELPGGYFDEGEEPMAAAFRELKEETGYVASEAQFLGMLWSAPSSANNRAYCYLLTGLTGPVQQELDDNEEIDVELYPFDELVDAAARAEIINNNSSNAALLMAAHQMNAESLNGLSILRRGRQ